MQIKGLLTDYQSSGFLALFNIKQLRAGLECFVLPKVCRSVTSLQSRSPVCPPHGLAVRLAVYSCYSDVCDIV